MVDTEREIVQEGLSIDESYFDREYDECNLLSDHDAAQKSSQKEIGDFFRAVSRLADEDQLYYLNDCSQESQQVSSLKIKYQEAGDTLGVNLISSSLLQIENSLKGRYIRNLCPVLLKSWNSNVPYSRLLPRVIHKLQQLEIAEGNSVFYDKWIRQSVSEVGDTALLQLMDIASSLYNGSDISHLKPSVKPMIRCVNLLEWLQVQSVYSVNDGQERAINKVKIACHRLNQGKYNFIEI